MNPQNTSFIPKRPTQGNVQNRGVRKIYILSYIAYVLFFGALVSAALVFLYTYTLQAKVTVEKTKLTQEQSRFGQGEIESVLRLEKLISTAEAKMDVHISLPRIFSAVESSALNSLVLTAFDYKRVGDEAPVITLTGEAKTFNSVLFQREVLASNPVLAKALFTKVEIGDVIGDDVERNQQTELVDDPVITFEISSAIDPSLVSYAPESVVTNTQNNFEQNQSETTVSDEETSGETSQETSEVLPDTDPEIQSDLE